MTAPSTELSCQHGQTNYPVFVTRDLNFHADNHQTVGWEVGGWFWCMDKNTSHTGTKYQFLWTFFVCKWESYEKSLSGFYFFHVREKKQNIKIQSRWPLPGWLKKKKKKDSDLVGILLKISSRQHRKRGKWCVCSEKEVGALDGAWLYVVLGAGRNLKSFKDTKELSTEGRLIHSQQTFTVWRQQAQPLKCLKLQDSLWAHDAAKTKLGLNPPGKKSHWQSLLTLLSHTHSNITQN